MSPPDASSATPATISGLGAIAPRYDAFILDLWGCIHNGVTPFPGVIDALDKLEAAGKRVLLMSNAPRRASAVAQGLPRFGLKPSHFMAIASSGEVAWQALARRMDPWHAALGKRALHVGPDRDLSMMEDNGLVRTTDPAQADFVLATGPNDDSYGIAEHEEILAAARARNLGFVCVNPDLDVIRGEQRLICAGALALRYAELGGDVRYHGKPYPSIYGMAREMLAPIKDERIVCVGDGLRTDILGAATAGLDCAFIPGGVHGEAMGIAMGGVPAPEALARTLAEFKLAPTYVLPELKW
jgi:HAD superfamily hydrolase (TIGR01459 family)